MQHDSLRHGNEAIEPNFALSMTPVPKAVSPYAPSDFGAVLTGARLFSSRVRRADLHTKREQPIRRTGAAFYTSTGEERLYKSRYLYGAWLDDMPFGTKRYTGIFTLSDGLILETQASNENAEILPHKSRLAETPS